MARGHLCDPGCLPVQIGVKQRVPPALAHALDAAACTPCIGRPSSRCPPSVPVPSVLGPGVRSPKGQVPAGSWRFRGCASALAGDTSRPVEEVQASSCSPRSPLCCPFPLLSPSTTFRLGEVTEPCTTSLSPVPCGEDTLVGLGDVCRPCAQGAGFGPIPTIPLDTLCLVAVPLTRSLPLNMCVCGQHRHLGEGPKDRGPALRSEPGMWFARLWR